MNTVPQKKHMKNASAKSRKSCAFIVLLCVGFAIVILLTVPRAVELFKEFDSDLPALTVFFLQMKFPMAVTLTLAAIALLAKEVILWHHPKVTHTINALSVMITGMLIGAMAVAFGLPLRALSQSVQ